MLARWTGLMERSTSVKIRFRVGGLTDFDWGLDLAMGFFLVIRCASVDVSAVLLDERCWMKVPRNVVWVKACPGREGAILAIRYCR